MLKTATSDDAKELFEIYNDPDTALYLPFEVNNLEDFQIEFAKLLANGEVLCMIQDDNIVAACHIERLTGRSSHVAVVSRFAVDHNKQSYGIGSNFFKEILNELKEDKSIVRIELSIESDNLEAMRFYQKFGFNHEGTKKKWFKRSDQSQYIDEHILGLIVENS